MWAPGAGYRLQGVCRLCCTLHLLPAAAPSGAPLTTRRLLQCSEDSPLLSGPAPRGPLALVGEACGESLPLPSLCGDPPPQPPPAQEHRKPRRRPLPTPASSSSAVEQWVVGPALGTSGSWACEAGGSVSCGLGGHPTGRVGRESGQGGTNEHSPLLGRRGREGVQAVSVLR